ncbi:bifunctional 4-hydroxy-2-oxoglutarate aldolase/2-dehydro-3-deoxy-phosphogluconate aldolase [Pectinatus cerevisiiphilus]|uniref:2-dehydro-3-deoxyphosphogluconate aldolase/(4S)-4-hydroxy-2-oxoglutarate aldolase n=1 Tax=Pectinatus cerevisiiphilus TaxID=86956 RepID=A0A4R3KFA5_9FIRM|nr:hypothetical protein [Pectinatus cerevisiiphilus]TCS81967.1 2-dehydro-3-deoxyphosphogluconate aldolase/(4S)-4-hydroxy-2-oxoglutarate aldolase [Pectinatus cerevisiiphilus]
MWKKAAALQMISDTGMMVIIRTDEEEEAYLIAKAVIEGGARALEFPYAVPGALRIVQRLTHEYSNILIGVGTVLDSEHAAAALLAGANMLVSSSFSPSMLKMAHQYQAVTVCGAMSPTEIDAAMAVGTDMVKLFPADFFGPQYIKTVHAPMPYAPIVPFGGVTIENVGEWFAAGAVAVGVGSYITKAHKKDGNYDHVVEATSKFIKRIKDIR